MGNVYFNARFDDVMLIVKREMASVLRGPLPATVRACAMITSSVFQRRSGHTGTCGPGRPGAGPVSSSGVSEGLFCSPDGSRSVCLLGELTCSPQSCSRMNNHVSESAAKFYCVIFFMCLLSCLPWF